MNRLAVLAIVAAAALGSVSGSYAAATGLLEASDDPRPTSKVDSPSLPEPDDLLYMTGSTIHDGTTQVRVTGLEGEVTALHRVEGGWLVVDLLSADRAAHRALFVGPNGAATELGSFLGDHDVDRDGTAVIALWEDSGAYQVRDIRSGEVSATMDFDLPGDPQGGATFGVGDMAVTVWVDDGIHRLVAWDVAAHNSYPMQPDFRRAVGASVGNHLAAFVESDPTCVRGGPILKGQPWWSECGLSPDFLPAFSPGGDALVTLTGQGTSLLVVDSESGDTSARVKAPTGSTDAVWESDQSVLVHSRGDGDMIHRCAPDSSCELLLRSDETLVLGQVH